MVFTIGFNSKHANTVHLRPDAYGPINKPQQDRQMPCSIAGKQDTLDGFILYSIS